MNHSQFHSVIASDVDEHSFAYSSFWNFWNGPQVARTVMSHGLGLCGFNPLLVKLREVGEWEPGHRSMDAGAPGVASGHLPQGRQKTLPCWLVHPNAHLVTVILIINGYLFRRLGITNQKSVQIFALFVFQVGNQSLS